MRTYNIDIKKVADDMEAMGFDLRSGMSGFTDCMLEAVGSQSTLEGDIHNELEFRIKKKAILIYNKAITAL